MITEDNKKANQEKELIYDLNIEEVNQLDLQYEAMTKLKYLFRSHQTYLEEHLAFGAIDTPIAKEVDGFSLVFSQVIEELESSTELISLYIDGLLKQLKQ